jgi:hypothetical protein
MLEYGSVCYSEMAKTDMAQYRGIRVALGLMCSTPIA